MKRMMLLACAVSMVAVYGCGPDDEGNNIITTNGVPNSTTPNNATTNSSTPNSTTGNNVIVVGDCNVQRNLGVLGDLLEVDGEFDASDENSLTGCAGDNPMGETDGSAILAFELDVPRRISVQVDGVPLFNNDEPVIPPDPSWEIRSAPCDTGDVPLCSVNRTEEFELPIGKYFLVIDGRLDSGGYEVLIESEELVCMPGSATCSNDQVERCVMGTALETFPCFDTCSSDTACTGDTCEDIVSVTIAANGAPYTISGHRRAQSNTWTALDRNGCELFQGDPPPDTQGVDLFVRIEGLTAGQTLNIDAERSDGNYAFFILADCAATSCLHAADFDGNSENKTSWNVTSSGSVVLVVEALGTTEREIEIDVSVAE